MENKALSNIYSDPVMSLPDAQRLFTYPRRAFARLPVGLTAAWLEFARMLNSIGLSDDGIIDNKFFDLLGRRFAPEVLKRAGIEIDPPGSALSHWRNPIKISLGMFALDLPLDFLLMRAAICRFPHRPSVQAMIDRVQVLAPATAEKMTAQFRPITVWSLADCLGDKLGGDFMNNHACVPRIRYALEDYAEEDLAYANRVIELMYKHPVGVCRYSSFKDAMRALRLDQILAGRADLRQELLLAFQSARGKRCR